MSATTTDVKREHDTSATSRAPARAKEKWWQTARARTAGLIALGIAVIGIIVWWFAFRPFVSTNDARVAMTFARIAPSGVGGRIEKVNVTEGSRVKAGDVLVEIDHRIPQANLDKAQSKFDLAQREYERMQSLAKEGSGTPQARDIAKSNAASANAELKLAEVAVENTSLKSPFDGIVVQKLADVGNLLEAGQTAAVVADESHAWVAANIEEGEVGKVQVGQAVKITIDEGGELTGKVSDVRASVASAFALIPSDTGSGNFTKVVQRIPIKIELDPHEGRVLRAGQSVEIKIRVH